MSSYKRPGFWGNVKFRGEISNDAGSCNNRSALPDARTVIVDCASTLATIARTRFQSPASDGANPGRLTTHRLGVPPVCALQADPLGLPGSFHKRLRTY